MKALASQRMLGVASIMAMLGAHGMPSIPRHPKVTHGQLIHCGGTFTAGRNAEKRAARNDPVKRMHMLANRRLRQRGVVRG